MAYMNLFIVCHANFSVGGQLSAVVFRLGRVLVYVAFYLLVFGIKTKLMSWLLERHLLLHVLVILH